MLQKGDRNARTDGDRGTYVLTPKENQLFEQYYQVVGVRLYGFICKLAFTYVYVWIRKEFLIGTVLYKTKSLDDNKPNTNPKSNPKTNPNPNTNPIQLFCAYFEHRPMIFELGSFLTVPIRYSCRGFL